MTPIVALVALLLADVPSASASAPSSAGDAALATRGQQLMQAKGCFSCHSTDGSSRTGPTFKGIWGRTQPNDSPLGARNVVIDGPYLLRALREPDADAPIGYRGSKMPKFDVSDDEGQAIIEALRYPELVDEAKARRGGSFTALIGCCAAFVLLHFALSAMAVRKQLQLAIGEKGFAAVYSLIALASFVGMVWFYRTAPFVELWVPPRWTRWIPVLVMPLAILMLNAGFSTPSPTSVGQESKAKSDPVGIQAVTRHPALWGFALWAMAHLATNGEAHVMLVAGAILVLAIGGMLHIDARRKATLGADWDAYAAKTSVLPFAAIAQGRARLVPSEIGLRRVLIAAVIYVAIFLAHPFVIGASPSP